MWSATQTLERGGEWCIFVVTVHNAKAFQKTWQQTSTWIVSCSGWWPALYATVLSQGETKHHLGHQSYTNDVKKDISFFFFSCFLKCWMLLSLVLFLCCYAAGNMYLELQLQDLWAKLFSGFDLFWFLGSICSNPVCQFLCSVPLLKSVGAWML